MASDEQSLTLALGSMKDREATRVVGTKLGCVLK